LYARKAAANAPIAGLAQRRMLEVLNRIVTGDGQDGDIELIEALGNSIKAGSLCGLGMTAPNPVLSAVKYFRSEFEEHIIHKKCTAGCCKELVKYIIDSSKCIGCTACRKICPVQAITGETRQKHEINDEICVKCGKCVDVCKFKAVSKG
jgi:ferredoxin